MARDYAKLMVNIWADRDFQALTSAAQRAYILAVSQPGMSYCGVVSYTPKRWAGFSADTSAPKIARAVRELQDRVYVVVDPETEELLVRSFVRHDGVLDSPNLMIAMWKDFASIHSLSIREVFLFELPEHVGFPEGLTRPQANPLAERYQEGFQEGLPNIYTSYPPTPSYSSAPVLEPFITEFDQFWDAYPRRVDRGHALKAYTARRNEGAVAVELETAARNYSKSCRSKNTAKEYIKHGKTFLAKDGPWTEWVAGPPEGEVASVSSNGMKNLGSVQSESLTRLNDDGVLECFYPGSGWIVQEAS